MLVRHNAIPAAYYAISGCSSKNFAIFAKFIEKYFPDISKAFLTSNDIYLILNALNRNHKIMIESVAETKRHGKKKESIIRYTNRPYREIFQEIDQASRCIRSVRYRAELDASKSCKGIPAFKGTISRE